MRNWAVVGAFFLIVFSMVGSEKGPKNSNQSTAVIYFSQPDADGILSPKDEVLVVRQSEDKTKSIIQFQNMHKIVKTLPKSYAKHLRQITFELDNVNCRFLNTSPNIFDCKDTSQQGVIARVSRKGVLIELMELRSGLFTGSLMGQEDTDGAGRVYATRLVMRFAGSMHYETVFYSNPEQVLSYLPEQQAVAKK